MKMPLRPGYTTVRQLYLPSYERDSKIMQGLIMEILNAQPSLRDSKTYINSFGPRAAKPHNGQPSAQSPPPYLKARHQLPFSHNDPSTSYLPHHAPPPPAPRPVGVPTQQQDQTRKTLRKDLDSIFRSSGEHQQLGATVEEEQQQALAASDSHHFAQPDVAIRVMPDAKTEKDASLQSSVTPATQAVLAEELSSPPAQQHTALVKVQGPFSYRQMESIAEGMVYLKRLGLVSVIVLDSEEPVWLSTVARFTSEGKLVQGEGEDTPEDLRQWMRGKGTASRSATVGKLQEALRKQMLSFATQLAELLTAKGAPARPFTHAMMRVDADAVHKSDAEHAQQPNTSDHVGKNWINKKRKSTDRSPLVSDDSLASVRRSLANDMIPIIAPLALYADPDANDALRTVCVRSDDVMVGLAREMSAEGKAIEAAIEQTGEMPEGSVDLMPLRLMVINREGGIPSHARGGNPHLSINLASEYSHILNSFIWDETHPTAVDNLKMVRDCLSYMPHTSSGVVVSHRSPKSLIANLITNKAAHSPSLPHRLLVGRKDVRHTPTIVRPGLSVHILTQFERVDQTKLTQLLETSFGRDLDAEAFYDRLSKNLDFVIVMGDYQGAAIVTHEYAPGEDGTTTESIAYLDKFAVLPSLQGSGAVDFLWGALRDEVHGLGLLDALNDNGGKGGFGKGRDLVWKSRTANPVNKWYFERSNGFLRLGKDWTMFWADAEQRLAIMSGERRLGAEASLQDILDSARESPTTWQARWGEDDEGSVTEGTRGRDGENVASLFTQQQARSRQGIDQLHRGDSERILPIIAPTEDGRLSRWARCMASIPSAWR